MTVKDLNKSQYIYVALNTYDYVCSRLLTPLFHSQAKTVRMFLIQTYV